MDGLEIRSSDIHCRGVFATRAFAAGDTAERCPVVVVRIRRQLPEADGTPPPRWWAAEATAMTIPFARLTRWPRS
jgi:hypothetical protein